MGRFTVTARSLAAAAVRGRWYCAAVDDLTLARLEHENMIETMSGMIAAAAGGLVRRERGVVLFASGLPIPLFNQVLIEAGTATDDEVGRAVATMRERRERFLLHLRRGVDDRFRPAAERLGLVCPADHTPLPGMALYPIPDTEPPLPADHEIRRVDSAAAMDDHIRTAAIGFGMPEEMIRVVMGPADWQRPNVTVYVGYSGGEPVTTGLGLRTGRTIGVYNIATVESARRRGLGAAMTARVARDGRAAGCDVAILQASDMGRATYERLGYRTVVEYDGFVEPGAAG
jgi:GNAT superfamily N-acetyltransferase